MRALGLILILILIFATVGAGRARADRGAGRIELLQILAEGRAALAHGEIDTAVERIAKAAALDPDSPFIAHDLAIARLRAGDLDGALAAVERSMALGNDDPEVFALEALILAQRDQGADAVEVARRAGTWESDLIAAVLGDAAAASRATGWVRESSHRGALTALVLSAYAGAKGERTSARNLAALSAQIAAHSQEPRVAQAAGELELRLGGGDDWIKAGTWLRTSFDYATNAELSAEGSGHRPLALRLAFSAEGAAQAPIGTARLDAAARIDQHVYLTARDRLAKLDVTGLALAASVEIPISSSPEAARVGLALRYQDLFGDAFRLHYATRFEGGPTLTIPFDLGTRLVLGIFGSATDFIDGSPPDALISSQNRDRFGQRASAAFTYEAEWFDVLAEALFLRDSAKGEAFDARGGALAARVQAYIEGGLILRMGFTALLRRFGPVGDPVILGSAATRTELRLAAELGAYVPISGPVALVIEDTWIKSSASAEHGYTENVVSVGMEARW
ncbi:MAG: tetratricopeptide repeat protein [Deltaproteobacteria bacterium]|nr:tetratricopeptide repeat protein [Deltaproteobacteria bacterium]